MITSARDSNPHYDPKRFLDTLQQVFNVKNDRQLAIRLAVQPPLLCKIRHSEIDVPASLLVSLTEETNFSIRELRAMMGDYRPHSGPSARHPSADELSAQRTLRVELVWRETPASAASAA